MLAVGTTTERPVRSALNRWPWAFAVSVNCPSCRRSRPVCEVIAHLNDDHRWSREKIGVWVAEIEPAEAQPPEDVPTAGGTTRAALAGNPPRSPLTRDASPVL
jgi:hypothetical protein